MSMFLSLILLVAAQGAPEDARAIAPFVGEEVAAVVRLDLVALEDVPGLARRAIGELAEERVVDDAAQAVGGWLGALREAGARELYFLIDPRDLPGAVVGVVPLAEGADAKAIAEALCAGGDRDPLFGWTTCASVRGAVVAGSPAALERVRKEKPTPRPELTAALAATERAPAALLIAPGATQRRTVEELAPTLPRELGGGPVTQVTRGLSWGAVALNVEPKPTLRVILQAADPDAARALGRIVGDLRALITKTLGDEKGGPAELAAVVGRLRPEVAGDQVTITVELDVATDLAAVSVNAAREAARRRQCTNNLKMIGLAMHNYHYAKKAFPAAAITDGEGKPLLSWRVALLPYLDQEVLYKEFHLDEPWDSPHNKALIERMPDVYACPSGALEPGRTAYRVFVGNGAAFEMTKPAGVRDFTDGTSNTVLVVEAAESVPWTQPEGLAFDPKGNPVERLGSGHPGGFHALIADGSVRFFAESIPVEILRAVITRAGGEVISSDAY